MGLVGREQSKELDSNKGALGIHVHIDLALCLADHIAKFAVDGFENLYEFVVSWPLRKRLVGFRADLFELPRVEFVMEVPDSDVRQLGTRI